MALLIFFITFVINFQIKNAEIERLNNQWKESQAKSEAQIFSFKENTQAEIREVKIIT